MRQTLSSFMPIKSHRSAGDPVPLFTLISLMSSKLGITFKMSHTRTDLHLNAQLKWQSTGQMQLFTTGNRAFLRYWLERHQPPVKYISNATEKK